MKQRPGIQFTRRQLLKSGASLSVAGMAIPAFAADLFPTHSVKLVVPFGPGSSTDIVARLVAAGMEGALGHPMIVDNRSGAGGNIATDIVAKSSPDGYTVLMGGTSNMVNPALYRKVNYDMARDFIPVGAAGMTSTLVIVPAASPIQSLKDLESAGQRGGGIKYASAGVGTSGHLGGELLKARLNGKMLHIPYREAGQALSALLAGDVDFMFYHYAGTLPLLRAGKVRALAVSSSRRLPLLPEVATVEELGLKDFDLDGVFMLYVPAGTPTPVVSHLREALNKALQSAETSEKLSVQGVQQRTFKPDELAPFIRAEQKKWGDMVRLSGASAD